jgi:hypothetical protein
MGLDLKPPSVVLQGPDGRLVVKNVRQSACCRQAPAIYNKTIPEAQQGYKSSAYEGLTPLHHAVSDGLARGTVVTQACRFHPVLPGDVELYCMNKL